MFSIIIQVMKLLYKRHSMSNSYSIKSGNLQEYLYLRKAWENKKSIPDLQVEVGWNLPEYIHSTENCPGL
jgi:hypothetical protein